jgi:hypothetical protein
MHCWTAGTYGSFGNPSTFLNQALHWNGSTRSLVSTPAMRARSSR